MYEQFPKNNQDSINITRILAKTNSYSIIAHSLSEDENKRMTKYLLCLFIARLCQQTGNKNYAISRANLQFSYSKLNPRF